MEDDLCSDDPWLVLHKIDSPTKMRFIGNRVAQCSFEESDKVAPSLAPYVKREALLIHSFPAVTAATACQWLCQTSARPGGEKDSCNKATLGLQGEGMVGCAHPLMLRCSCVLQTGWNCPDCHGLPAACLLASFALMVSVNAIMQVLNLCEGSQLSLAICQLGS